MIHGNQEPTMSLESIAKDIRDHAAEQLAAKGLSVVARPTDDIEHEDHQIALVDKDGREHVVSIQVSSHAPSWRDASISVQMPETKAIPGTRFTQESVEAWLHIEFKTRTAADRIGEIVDAVEQYDRFVPVGDIEAGIVTDFWIADIAQRLLALGEATGRTGDIDIFTKPDGEPVSVVLIGEDGMSVAQVSCSGHRLKFESIHVDPRQEWEVSGLRPFLARFDAEVLAPLKASAEAAAGPKL
jgi:hypothetical protein